MPKTLSTTERRTAKRQANALAAGTRNAERGFVKDLTSILKGFSNAMVKHLEKSGHAITQDALGSPSGKYGKDIDAVVKHLIPQLGPKVEASHKRMAESL